MQNFQGVGLAMSNCMARSPKYCINIIRGSHIRSIQHIKAECAKANKKCSKGTWSVTKSIKNVTRAVERTDL